MGRPRGQSLDVLCPEGFDAAGQLHRPDPSLSDGGDERGRSHAGGSDRVRRIQKSLGYDFPSGYSSPPGADDVGLTDVTDEGADLAGGQSAAVSIHDRCVPDEADHIVLSSGPSVLLLGLDQPLAQGCQLAALLIAFRLAHVCQYDIHEMALAIQPSRWPIPLPSTEITITSLLASGSPLAPRDPDLVSACRGAAKERGTNRQVRPRKLGLVAGLRSCGQDLWAPAAAGDPGLNGGVDEADESEKVGVVVRERKVMDGLLVGDAVAEPVEAVEGPVDEGSVAGYQVGEGVAGSGAQRVVWYLLSSRNRQNPKVSSATILPEVSTWRERESRWRAAAMSSSR